MKRIIHTDQIKTAIEELVFRANFILPRPVLGIFEKMKSSCINHLERETLGILAENARIAASEKRPLCQDCGSVMIFISLGQDVSIEGEFICDAVNAAVADSYEKYLLRKSIAGDPLRRENTGTNTPAFMHIELLPGDSVQIDLMLKGGGSENMSSLKMFRPTDDVETIVNHIVDRVVEAGPNPCPPLYLGVGIGGTADSAMINSRKAVLRNPLCRNSDPYYASLEEMIFEKINSSGIGPLGFGGINTVFAVSIIEAPTHIATLPVALNLQCHSLRRERMVL